MRIRSTNFTGQFFAYIGLDQVGEQMKQRTGQIVRRGGLRAAAEILDHRLQVGQLPFEFVAKLAAIIVSLRRRAGREMLRRSGEIDASG